MGEGLTDVQGVFKLGGLQKRKHTDRPHALISRGRDKRGANSSMGVWRGMFNTERICTCDRVRFAFYMSGIGSEQSAHVVELAADLRDDRVGCYALEMQARDHLA